VLLGQTLADRRDNAGARAAYDAALKIAPNSAYVKLVLLPSVK
jgi:cytochrome c-type biogenesis protein CcmH/NrfG